MNAGRVITLLGAESTGKSTLAIELARVMSSRGVDAVMVPEALRLFCEHHGRTPQQHEQADIAAEQTRLIEQARASHQVVLADTSALMIAVYSDYIFGDRSLYASALKAHAPCDATLLMSMDLAWAADGFVRDGEHAREPVDGLVRAALQGAGLSYNVVAGHGIARVNHALSVIDHLLDAPARQQRQAGAPRWRWFCDNCDDGECEQHWLPRSGKA
ncbi:MAG: ATPase [Aquabacterium sp.]|uniref:ATP-binding protein n=1 Tax=Aquabacterium sp. TaxID=1872578 RepID=UPI001207C1CA|nr:ATP-binding protein [Aquabacterium sp.]TAK93929.1 MAG: ATPase [Aquabacterium sp.]